MRATILLVAVAVVLATDLNGSHAATRLSITGSAIVAGAKGAPVDSSDVVVWLKPAGDAAPPALEIPRQHLKIVQHNKRFEPRQLVLPVGSVVDFPNLDPFFHNVFSLFDGKRFDLGLYEAGSSRSVTFGRAGVCYIFCNIHPEMSAVVLALDTPYYGISNRSGDFVIPNVPAGPYVVNVWHERHKLAQAEAFPRAIVFSDSAVSIGPIRLSEVPDLMPHKNKFGKDYPPPPGIIYKK